MEKSGGAFTIVIKIANVAMMFEFMKMTLGGIAVNVINMRKIVDFSFSKRKKKNEQDENGKKLFHFLHERR